MWKLLFNGFIILSHFFPKHSEKEFLVKAHICPLHTGSCRTVWRLRGSACATFFTTTTPSEACGTPKTKRARRDSLWWTRATLPAHPLCVTCDTPVGAHCLPGLSFLSAETGSFRAPLVPHWSVSHTRPLEKLGFWTLQVSRWDRRRSGCLTDCESLCRGETYFSLSFSLVFFGAMFSDRRGCSFLCVCADSVYGCFCFCVCAVCARACAYGDGKHLFSFSLFLTQSCEDLREPFFFSYQLSREPYGMCQHVFQLVTWWRSWRRETLVK